MSDNHIPLSNLEVYNILKQKNSPIIDYLKRVVDINPKYPCDKLRELKKSGLINTDLKTLAMLSNVSFTDSISLEELDIINANI